MVDSAVTWNRRPAPAAESNTLGALGQAARQKKQLTTIEAISIIGLGVSTVSLIWSMYTFSKRKEKC